MVVSRLSGSASHFAKGVVVDPRPSVAAAAVHSAQFIKTVSEVETVGVYLQVRKLDEIRSLQSVVFSTHSTVLND
jgi:hypothetical protein